MERNVTNSESPIVSIRSTKDELWKNTVRSAFNLGLVGLGVAGTFAWGVTAQYPLIGFIAVGAVLAVAIFYTGTRIGRRFAERDSAIKLQLQQLQNNVDRMDFMRKYEPLIEAIKDTAELGNLLRSDYVHLSKSHEQTEYRETMLLWWDNSLIKDIGKVDGASEQELIEVTRSLFSFCTSLHKFTQANSSIVANSFQTKFNRIVIHGIQRIALSSRYRRDNGANSFGWYELEEINIPRIA